MNGYAIRQALSVCRELALFSRKTLDWIMVSPMMTQVQGAIATQVNEQATAQSQLEQYIEEPANGIEQENAKNFSLQTLKDATTSILHYAFWLANQKKTHSRACKKLLSEQGWKGEEKKYLKIAAAFDKFSPQELAQIEPATIFLLANNNKKYQPVLEQLLDLPEITQSQLRELIKQQRQPKKFKQEKPSIWRRTKNGRRYCQIPPIHEENEQTGVALQKMMDEEGLTAQQIVAEAIALRQEYKQGKLVYNN